MDSQQIVPYRPLPPQRWGFLPTNQFWAHAWLTPISIIFWAGAAVFFSCFDLFALAWWQQSLGFLVFYGVWGGLVERYTRRYLASRRVRALAGPRTAPHEGLEDATVVGPVGPGASSGAPVPSREPRPELSFVATAETWDLVYERLFGRGADIAQLAFNIVLGLAIFYPSWVVKLLAFLAMLAASLGLGSWQRRQAMAAGEPKPVPAPPPLQAAASTGKRDAGARAGGCGG